MRPLAPVHPKVCVLSDHSLTLGWTRRARGAWLWHDEVEVPLGEEAESYVVGVGAVDSPALRWNCTAPELTLSPTMLATLRWRHAGESIWVRQVGSFAMSPPLLLTTIT